MNAVASLSIRQQQSARTENRRSLPLVEDYRVIARDIGVKVSMYSNWAMQ